MDMHLGFADGSSAYDSKNGVEYIFAIASGTPPAVEFNIFAVDVVRVVN